MKKKVWIIIIIFISIVFIGSKYNQYIADKYGYVEPKKEVKLNASLLRSGSTFIIKNKDNFDYEDVTLELNDNYKLKIGTIRSGKMHTAGIMEFSNSNDDRFTNNKKPKKMTLICTVSREITVASWKLE